MNKLIQEIIKKLVKKYADNGNKELFKLELEHLVTIAEREQIIEDKKTIDRVLGQLNS